MPQQQVSRRRETISSQFSRLQVGQGRNVLLENPASSTQEHGRMNYRLQTHKPIHFICSWPDDEQHTATSPRPTNPPKDASGSPQQTQFRAQATSKETKALNTPQHKDTDVHSASLSSGQSVQANSVNSSSLNNMFKVAAIVQQIMTELNGAVMEEQKVVAITRLVFNLMKENGH